MWGEEGESACWESFAMNSFDSALFHFFNSLAQRNYTFDTVMVRTMEGGLTTGAVIVALFWAAWEIEGAVNPEKREILLFGLFTSIFSIFVARVLALTLPFRVRPLHATDIGFRIPYNLKTDMLINWSSFPSDHATLFTCLAAILWMVSRRLGIIAFVYVVLMIDIPRIYAGIHYPTDIIAGTILGLAVAMLVKLPKLRSVVTRPALHWKEAYPLFFNFALFMCAFEVGELFATVRDLGSYAMRAAHIASHLHH